MDLLEDLAMSLLNFNFVMIYIIHKMVLHKNHLNYLNNNDFECFLKEYMRIVLFFLKKDNNFFHII